MSRGWVLLGLLLCAPRALAGAPVFIDFSEDPEVPNVPLDDGDQRALAKQLVKAGPFHLRDEDCKDESDSTPVVLFIQSIRAPAATEEHPRLLHTVRVRSCDAANRRWGEGLLVLSERGRVLTKVKANFAGRFVKVFKLDAGGPEGVVIADGETLQGYTVSSAAVYALEKGELRELQNLHFVQNDSCGLPENGEERRAVFFLKSANPWVLLQKNYSRPCDAEDERFKLINEGRMKD